MNKTILVTGGALRIGSEIVTSFAKMGWDIILHYRNSSEEAKKIKKNLEDLYETEIFLVQGDLNLDEDVQNLIDIVNKNYKNLDALVNNASSFYNTEIGNLTNANWDDLVGNNLKAPLFLINGLKDILMSASGSVINITDVNIDMGSPNYSIYTAAKGGLAAITKSLAKELAPNITVNAVAPGAILEPPGVTWDDDKIKEVIKNIPLNRMGNEKDIANAVRFLVYAKYITGQTIRVDGGKSLQ
jgi:pteridine reductase